MAGIKGRSGGARTGAGRTSLSKKNNNKRIPISDQIYDLLSEYSVGLGLSKSDIVESLCLLYLDRHNKDIEHCPKCSRPVFWGFVQGGPEKCEAKCQCGEIVEIDGEEPFNIPDPIAVISLKELDEFDLGSLKPGEAIKIK